MEKWLVIGVPGRERALRPLDRSLEWPMSKKIARLPGSRLFVLNLRHGACRDEVLVRVALGKSLKAGPGACGHFLNEKASWSAVDCLGPHQNKNQTHNTPVTPRTSGSAD